MDACTESTGTFTSTPIPSESGSVLDLDNSLSTINSEGDHTLENFGDLTPGDEVTANIRADNHTLDRHEASAPDVVVTADTNDDTPSTAGNKNKAKDGSYFYQTMVRLALLILALFTNFYFENCTILVSTVTVVITSAMCDRRIEFRNHITSFVFRSCLIALQCCLLNISLRSVLSIEALNVDTLAYEICILLAASSAISKCLRFILDAYESITSIILGICSQTLSAVPTSFSKSKSLLVDRLTWEYLPSWLHAQTNQIRSDLQSQESQESVSDLDGT